MTTMQCFQFVRQKLIFLLFVPLAATIIIIASFRNEIRHFYHSRVMSMHSNMSKDAIATANGTFRDKQSIRPTTIASRAMSIHSKMPKDPNATANGTFHDKQSIGPKRILFYTAWFGMIPWPVVDAALRLPCSHKCLTTYNKKELHLSDAVVFHEIDLSYDQLKRVSRSPHQRWVYFTHESPQLSRSDATVFNGLFNWTSSYKFDSDIVHHYGYYSALELKRNNSNNINYAKGKDKLIAWAVSHCGAGVRDKIVHKILQFLNVTVIGKCSHLFNQVSPEVCKRGSTKCGPYMKRFKFYLSFENGLCIDYVTEKYWSTPLGNNMIPIVLGGSNYDDAKVAIPGSYINILDFPSIRAFSDYIKYLDKNDTAYNEYFSWKTKFKLDSIARDRWLCRLCVNLHNDSLPRKVYKDLGSFHGIQKNCHRYKEKVQRLLQ